MTCDLVRKTVDNQNNLFNDLMDCPAQYQLRCHFKKKCPTWGEIELSAISWVSWEPHLSFRRGTSILHISLRVRFPSQGLPA